MVQADSGIRTEIDQVNRRFEEALEQGDAATVGSVYTDDAVLLPPNGPMTNGRDAITKFWQGVMDMGVRGIELNTLSLVEDGDDAAHEIGTASLAIKPEGGEPTTDIVKYVVVWRREAAGEWKMAVDIWNGDS
jgi:uncharacterized protein (TIGR02246 family)